MPNVVGVKLRFASKTLWFDPGELDLAEGDSVVVSTARGPEWGVIVIPAHEVDDSQVTDVLKPVLRIATEEDWDTFEALCKAEDEARPIFRRMVAERGLDMKPLIAEWMFDRSKLVFYYVSEDRVDFRDLVKDLATEFKTRIEMRQVGVRDEARMVGGHAHCGEQLCCARFAGDFQPVSIRMAKEQDLPLNPVKISGVCGRLMCCLRYEFEAYKDFKLRAPKKNALIDTPQGQGKVVAFDTPREVVTVRTMEGDLKVPLAAMDCCHSDGTPCDRPCRVTAAALEEFRPPEPTHAMFGDTRGLKPAEAMVHPEAPPAEERPARPKRSRRGKRGGGGEGAVADRAAKPAAAPGAKPAATAGAATAAADGTAPRKARRRRGGRGRGTGSAEGQAPQSAGAAPSSPAAGGASAASGTTAAGGTTAASGGETAGGPRRRRRRHGPEGGATE